MVSRRGAVRRALAAGLGVLAAFVLQPAAVGRAGISDTSNSTCPVFTGIPAATGQVLKLTGSLQCFRPGAARFGSNVAQPNTQDRVQPPALPTLGQPCRNVFNHSVTFTEDAVTPDAVTGAAEFANFSFANGAFQAHQLDDTDATMIGTNDAVVTDEQLGSYELSNPNDPNSSLACQIDPTFHFFCPPDQLDVMCLQFTPHTITPQTSAPPPWGPYFAAALGNIAGEAGQIHSSPATHGVVNTPVCFWIDNMGIPQERDLTLTLAGAPDSSGRQIFYTYLAKIRFDGIDWKFDDPQDPDNTQVTTPPGCQQQHPQLTAHVYRQISDGQHSDNTYHVRAVENYSISVVVFWWEWPDGQQTQVVKTGVPQAPAIRPTDDLQYVGQVEGIPIGSP